MSGGLFRGTADAPGGSAAIEKIVPGFLLDPAAANRKLRLFFFTCGTEDPRMPGYNQAAKDFRARQINFVLKSYPGEHEWKVWRHSLADMAPLLFR